MALNTLKSTAERVIEDGGWARLNEMRKAYLAASKISEKVITPGHSKVAELKARLAELELALDVERRYRIRLQISYEALLNRMRSMAQNDPELGHFINRHVAGFSCKRLSVAGKARDADDE